MDLITEWENIYENSETESNIIIDNNGGIIFYHNQYADTTLHERKNGRLLCLSPDGEEKWAFAFPDYNYLFFTGRIGLGGNLLYVIADSTRQYDSGYERGLYIFDITGTYKTHYPADALAKKPVKVPKIEEKEIAEEVRLSVEKKMGKRRVSAITTADRIIFCLSIEKADNKSLNIYSTCFKY